MSSRQFVPSPNKRKTTRIVIIVVILGIIFAVPFMRRSFRSGVSTIGLSIGRVTHSIGSWFGSLGTAVRSKYALEAENNALEAEIGELNARLTSYNAVAGENADLKKILGRTDHAEFTLAAVIEKPPHSIYDTLVIDGGAKANLSVGQLVYANGETPIGFIQEVRSATAIVELYSAPGETFSARLSVPGEATHTNIDVDLIGRGGGNFSATIPHDIVITPGTVVVTKEIHPYTVAIFQKVTSDARDPFQTLLLSAPVNINELSFVVVRQK